MPQDYYPSGPFLSQLPDAGRFDVLREDFLLGFAARTARAYKADLEDFREWCQSESIDSVSPPADCLERYLTSVANRGYATGTIRRRSAALRGFFTHLVARRVLPSSPARHLRPVGGEDRAPRQPAGPGPAKSPDAGRRRDRP